MLAGILFLGGCAGRTPTARESASSTEGNQQRLKTRNDQGLAKSSRDANSFTKIQGQLFLDGGILPLPLKFQRIALLTGATEKKEVLTDAEGRFVLSGPFQSGEYQVRLKSAHYQAEAKIQVDGANAPSVILRATPLQRL